MKMVFMNHTIEKAYARIGYTSQVQFILIAQQRVRIWVRIMVKVRNEGR